MSNVKLCLIAACDAKLGIGLNNNLPWRLKKEMAYFNRMTTGGVDNSSTKGKKSVVVMGRKTWDSIPSKFKPLKDRLNIVLSRNNELPPQKDLVHFKRWEDVIKYLEQSELCESINEEVWIVGGSALYQMGLDSPALWRIYLTRIQKDFNCDTFFPQFDESKFTTVRDPRVPAEEQEEEGIHYTFHIYEKLLGK